LCLGEARVAYLTQSSQRDAELAEKGFDGPAGLLLIGRRVPVQRRAKRIKAAFSAISASLCELCVYTQAAIGTGSARCGAGSSVGRR
jgi:hypothetical protein